MKAGPPQGRAEVVDPGMIEVRESSEGARLRVRVRPRAARDALAGEREGALVVRVAAPPVEGAANAALARFLGRALDVAPSAVRILRGASGRDKIVSVDGLDAAAVRARLSAFLASR